MGGLLNFCSTNNGKERHDAFKYLAPYPATNYAEILIPKNNKLGSMTRGRRIPGYESGCPGGIKSSCEGYKHPQKTPDDSVGIY
jgi:hypothetical protein